MNPDTSFGGLIKARRTTIGMSQAKLADLVGRSASAIRSWERGSSTPTDESVVQSLAAVLGIDEAQLRETVGLPPVDPDADLPGDAALDAFVGEQASVEDESLDGGGQPSEEVVAPSDEEVEPAESGGLPEDESKEPKKVQETENDSDRAGEAAPGSEASPPPGEGTPHPAEGDSDQAADDEASPEPSRDEAETAAEEVVSFPAVAAVDQATVVEPVAVAVAEAPMTATRVDQHAVTPAPRSYLDDPDQMMTYWIRAALTVAFAVFLLIVLFWALGRLGDSVAEVWELLKAGA